jgi:formate/nitrite transporter FocA (FNT family)
VLLGLDLVTGSFGLLPLPWIESDTDAKTICSNWGWVFLGNLIGSVVYGALLAIALTNFGANAPAGVAAKIVAIAEAKTTGYEALGYAGLITVFVKAILCNWMVCLAIVAAMRRRRPSARSRARICRYSSSSRRVLSIRS